MGKRQKQEAGPAANIEAALDDAIALYSTMHERCAVEGLREEATHYAEALRAARGAKEELGRLTAAVRDGRNALGQTADLAAESEGSSHAFDGFFDPGGPGYEAWTAAGAVLGGDGPATSSSHGGGQDG